MNIPDNELYRVVNAIHMRPGEEQEYSNLYHHLAPFLINESGLSIAEIGRAGSIIQQTAVFNSDLDVPMVMNPQKKNPREYLPVIEGII